MLFLFSVLCWRWKFNCIEFRIIRLWKVKNWVVVLFCVEKWEHSFVAKHVAGNGNTYCRPSLYWLGRRGRQHTSLNCTSWEMSASRNVSGFCTFFLSPDFQFVGDNIWCSTIHNAVQRRTWTGTQMVFSEFRVSCKVRVCALVLRTATTLYHIWDCQTNWCKCFRRKICSKTL